MATTSAAAGFPSILHARASPPFAVGTLALSTPYCGGLASPAATADFVAKVAASGVASVVDVADTYGHHLRPNEVSAAVRDALANATLFPHANRPVPTLLTKVGMERQGAGPAHWRVRRAGEWGVDEKNVREKREECGGEKKPPFLMPALNAVDFPEAGGGGDRRRSGVALHHPVGKATDPASHMATLQILQLIRAASHPALRGLCNCTFAQLRACAPANVDYVQVELTPAALSQLWGPRSLAASARLRAALGRRRKSDLGDIARACEAGGVSFVFYKCFGGHGARETKAAGGPDRAGGAMLTAVTEDVTGGFAAAVTAVRVAGFEIRGVAESRASVSGLAARTAAPPARAPAPAAQAAAKLSTAELRKLLLKPRRAGPAGPGGTPTGGETAGPVEFFVALVLAALPSVAVALTGTRGFDADDYIAGLRRMDGMRRGLSSDVARRALALD